MKKIFTLSIFLIFFCSCQKELYHNLRLWSDHPANTKVEDRSYEWADDKEWLKAFPLGNGSLGAMVYGDVALERIQLSEESMWSGSPQESDNPQAAQHLDRIRKFLFQGKYKEATELTNKTQICIGEGSGGGNGSKVPFGCFQTLGDLWIEWDNKKEYTNYHRELDLSNAMVKISYTQAGIDFRRETFISYPDQVLVIRFIAEKPGNISFNCRMTRPERSSTYTQNKQLIMEGSLSDGKGGDGLAYMARLKALKKGGEIAYTDSSVIIKGADEVVLLVSASTNYKLEYPTYKGRAYKQITKDRIEKAEQKSYNQLLSAHVADFKSYFDRASFRLGNVEPDTIVTDKRIKKFRETYQDNHLYELLFQYGRYLLISSSRPGTLPANLQGIWANKIQTPWNGDYHTDVNVEMNYWPAEVTNLSELHLPMFDLIESLVVPGSKTAQVQYGLKGWVVHPITNPWGYTSPGEYASWGMHTGAPAWICQHIGEHYRFTGDKEFLQKMYPVLTGAVEFYMGWLTEHPQTKKLVSGPAVSPENTFISPDGTHCQISMGPSHDQQVIWQLFDDYEMVSRVLGIDNPFVREVATVKSNLAETKIGSDGRLMEWADEFPEAEPGHRHISHLFAVHPGSQINPINTPELIDAARLSLDYRLSHGGGHTGWSAAWLISQYARLLDAERAKENLDLVMAKSINPNLFSSCPPFQMDANFGTTAGIAEMLLQSHVKDSDDTHIVQLLPALPKAWANGQIKGIKARGGLEVSLKWKNNLLELATIRPAVNGNYILMYGTKRLKMKDLKAGKIYKIGPDF